MEAHTLTAAVQVELESGYLLYLPEHYQSTDALWPLVIFLHGSGERGDDLDLVKVHGPPKLISGGKAFPFIMVAPQCPEDDHWSNPAQVAWLHALIKKIIHTHRVDPRRVYLTGLSMGGFGTWAVAAEDPDVFAAIAPICGRGHPEFAPRLAGIPTWVFHGEKDQAVPIGWSIKMVEAMQAVDADIRFTIYPDAGHDCWTRTYENPDFYEWMLSQERN